MPGAVAARPIAPVLLAKDLATARELYHDKLGLQILRENENAIVFRCGGGTHLDVTKIDPGKNALGILQLKH